MTRLIEQSNVRHQRTQMFWISLCAFLARVLAIFLYRAYSVSPGFEWAYEPGMIAQSILQGRGFSSPFGGDTGPTAIIAPVYPYLIAFVMKLFGVFTRSSALVLLLLNALAAGATCPFIVMIAEKINDRRSGLIAAWIFALAPFFIAYSSATIWDYSFAALELSAAVWVALHLEQASLRWIQLAILFSVMALQHTALLAALPFLVLLGIHNRRRTSQNWLKPAMTFALCFAMLVGPWLVRNRVVFGEWVFIRDNFGLDFRIGNYYGSNWMGWHGYHPSHNAVQFARFQAMGELRYIQAVSAEAKAFVRSHPRDFLNESAKRFWYFWNGEIYTLSADVAKQWTYAVLSLFAWLGWLLMLRKPDKGKVVALGAVMLFYPFAYYIVFIQPRYRHAIEPLMLIFAVSLFRYVIDRVRERKEVVV
jgi:4-amino-4-deoxy-L-arabinose transferase-like glycosyltransferase